MWKISAAGYTMFVTPSLFMAHIMYTKIKEFNAEWGVVTKLYWRENHKKRWERYI